MPKEIIKIVRIEKLQNTLRDSKMKFYVTLGKCKITLKDIMLSIVPGVFISIIILLWQLVGLIERPLVYSMESFIGSSLGFALLIIGFAGFLGTIEEVRKELQGKDKAMVEQHGK